MQDEKRFNSLTEIQKERHKASLFVFGACVDSRQEKIKSFLICPAKKVVCGCFVEIRKLDQYCGGNIIFAGFVFGITSLRHTKKLCDLLLC